MFCESDLGFEKAPALQGGGNSNVLVQDKSAQLHAVEEEEMSGKPENFRTEGKQADLAAIMDTMWGSSRF